MGDDVGVDEHQLLTGKNGAVTSDVEQCSVIGIDLMKMGGNAVDAAIGMLLGCSGFLVFMEDG